MTTIPTITVQSLYPFIGRQVRFLGTLYQLIDVVEDDGPLLVLEDPLDTTIQSDQYGDPQCRVPTLMNIPVYHKGQQRLHPDFEGLELL